MKKQLVIVDDDVAICQVLQMLLCDLCNVVYFHDVDTAKEYVSLHSKEIKALILDFNIGKDSGIDFYKEEILNKKRNIPGILISGFIVTQLKTDRELVELNKMFSRVFEKPFDFVVFREYLEKEIFS
jgi:DNA-binding NtrC family response regulator